MGAFWYNFFAATGEYFYHANIRTPKWLRYCGIRPMPITQSGVSRSPIPAQADHLFRSKPITNSGGKPISFRPCTGIGQAST
jgi:hypothetical protein